MSCRGLNAAWQSELVETPVCRPALQRFACFNLNSSRGWLTGQLYSRLFQLGVLFDQLFQTVSWKLYRNLRVFPISLALVDHSLAVLRMANALTGLESGASRGGRDLD